MFLFRYFGIFLFLFSSLPAKAEAGARSGRAEGFRFSVVASKKIYAEGAEIILFMRLGNRTSNRSEIQFDSTRTQVVVTRNRVVLGKTYGASDFDFRATPKNPTVRLGEALEWPIFVPGLVSFKPGAYNAKFRLYIGNSKDATDPRPVLEGDFLEASTEFEVVQASQRPDSTAVPLEDLKVSLADSRNVDDRRDKPLILRLDVANIGREPWFYREQDKQRGIQFEITDSKDRVVGRSRKGEILADSSPERFIRYSGPGARAIEFLPGVTEHLGSFKLEDYALLAPGSFYTVHVSWKGNVYRSSTDRAARKNAVSFEIRSSALSVRTPRE